MKPHRKATTWLWIKRADLFGCYWYASWGLIPPGWVVWVMMEGDLKHPGCITEDAYQRIQEVCPAEPTQ